MRDLTGTASFVLILFVAASTVPASAEACKGSDAPTPELRHYDATATRPLPDTDAVINTHLPWGQPACPKLLPNREYVLCYTAAQRVPLCAAHETRREDGVNRTGVSGYTTLRLREIIQWRRTDGTQPILPRRERGGRQRDDNIT